MTTKTHDKPANRPLPIDLAAVALIDARTCAAAGSMSLSWWLEEVRTGRAPAPAIREPRCTRWRLADVQTYWARRSAPGDASAHVGGQTVARAKKASEAAQAKRDAAREVAK